MSNSVTEQKDPEDDNNFVICTNEDHMSNGYNGDNEWEDLSPAATYSERLIKKKIAARAVARVEQEKCDLKHKHVLSHSL